MNENTTLFDQKTTEWVKHKKGKWVKTLAGPINWVGQTLMGEPVPGRPTSSATTCQY